MEIEVVTELCGKNGASACVRGGGESNGGKRVSSGDGGEHGSGGGGEGSGEGGGEGGGDGSGVAAMAAAETAVAAAKVAATAR